MELVAGSAPRTRVHTPPSGLAGLTAVGWSHRSAPLAELERVALSHSRRAALLDALAAAGDTDVVVLSTCSRTELYAGPGGPGPDALLTALARQLHLPAAELSATSERRAGLDVVEHLFRVTSGLESRVVGEAEIRAQVRGAVREAQSAGSALAVLGPLFAAAVRCAARVDAVTALSGQARSLGRRAVDVGLARTGSLADPVVLVVGAGRMARTAVERLAELGTRPRVAARSTLEAARLVGPTAVCPLSALAAAVQEADLLLCATSASHDVVTLEHVRAAMETRSRPLTVVDLSVPRNRGGQVGALPGVHLLDVEGLHDDLGADPALAAALAAGSAVVQTEVGRYAEAVSARAAGPLIAAVRESVEQLCSRELTRIAAGHVEPEVLARAAHAIAGKLLHQPTLAARTAAASGDARLLGVLEDLFCESEAGKAGARSPR